VSQRDLSNFFFIQAEDGIRDRNVTGVQTCALLIYKVVEKVVQIGLHDDINTEILSGLNEGDNVILSQTSANEAASVKVRTPRMKIGRASCREREKSSEDDQGFKRE